MKKYWIALFCSMLILNSCKTVPPKYPTALDDMHATLQQGIKQDKKFIRGQSSVPSAVNDALLPSIKTNLPMSAAVAEHRFNISADKMPARLFFTGLVEGTSYNMVVSPDIDGAITLSLKNVTIEEAMNAVRDMYGYEYTRTSYGYEVSPPELATQMFSVNYLDLKRSGKSSTQVTSSEITNSIGTISAGGSSSSSSGSMPTPTGIPSSTGQGLALSSSVDTSSEINFWKDLERTLKGFVPEGQGRSVVVNSQGGMVIVKAFPRELHRVAQFLDRIQANLQRQVVIEAKILEVRLGNNFQAGIDWSLLGNPLNGQALLSQAMNGPNSTGASGGGAIGNTGMKNFDGVFSVTTKGSFRTLMRFLQTQGNVQTLSSPRISTVNNQKAVIKVGQDEFFVTGVSTTNTIVGTNTLPSQSVNLTPFFSGVTLDVTPQVGKNGSIILHIHPSISTVEEQQKNILLGTNGTSQNNLLSLPLALSQIRESDNIVRAQSGQMVVIGGLIENVMQESISGTPYVSRIPFIGALFRRTSQVALKAELVILLRPEIVDSRLVADQLQTTDKRLRGLKRDFHLGGFPETFGDEAEDTDRNDYSPQDNVASAQGMYKDTERG